MSSVLKLFRHDRQKKKKRSLNNEITEIGTPTCVKHNFGGKVNPDGTIEGFPESWRQRLKLMITAEEAQDPENAEKAAVIFKWIDDRGPGMRGGESDEFMHCHESPANSLIRITPPSPTLVLSLIHI